MGIATILVLLSGSSLYAYSSVEEDPQVGTKAKGTYFKARIIDSLTSAPIEFGTLSERDVKLTKLRKFYDNGLSHIGHIYYKSIDVRFDKQVICTK